MEFHKAPHDQKIANDSELGVNESNRTPQTNSKEIPYSTKEQMKKWRIGDRKNEKQLEKLSTLNFNPI